VGVVKQELLISRSEIQQKVKELAGQISSDYRGKAPVFIGVLNGVVFFFSDLVRQVDLPSRIDFIRVASYGSGMNSSGTLKMTKDVELPLKGEHVIVVEDIVDTGFTLSRLVRRLEEKGCESIRICALIDKVERRQENVTITYCGFSVEEGFLVGYGLDHDEKYRHLPDIYLLR
jgi:hypoxanthine phosphoribosyltransferase